MTNSNLQKEAFYFVYDAIIAGRGGAWQQEHAFNSNWAFDSRTQSVNRNCKKAMNSQSSPPSDVLPPVRLHHFSKRYRLLGTKCSYVGAHWGHSSF